MGAMRRRGPVELAIVLWGTSSVVAVCVQAVVRLLPNALEPVLAGELDALGWGAYVAAIVSLAYSEGYRGFQKRFSPRVVVRAAALAEPAMRRRIDLIVLAPLMTMGMIHATRRRLIGSWGLVIGIVAIVLLVRMLEQPWRGAIDAGVVVGLSWGSIATLGWLVAWWRGRDVGIDPDLPGTK